MSYPTPSEEDKSFLSELRSKLKTAIWYAFTLDQIGRQPARFMSVEDLERAVRCADALSREALVVKEAATRWLAAKRVALAVAEVKETKNPEDEEL